MCKVVLLRRPIYNPAHLVVGVTYSPGGSTWGGFTPNKESGAERNHEMPCPEKVIVKAYVSPEEYQNIKAAASQAKLSLSAFTRAVCLGYEPKSKVDNEAILAMIGAKNDLARLGNLLKLALDLSKVDEKRVENLLDSIQESREVLTEILHKINEKVSKK